MNEKLKVALIYGSTREGRLCDKVGAWAAREVTAHGDLALDLIDPAALDLPDRHEAQDGPAVQGLAHRIANADAFVVVTPEYNHGYPAALKFVIDSVGTEWNGKPVAFVSYGGVSGGLRAVEQLRLVFAKLHAVTTRDGVAWPARGARSMRAACSWRPRRRPGPWPRRWPSCGGGPWRSGRPGSPLLMERSPPGQVHGRGPSTRPHEAPP